jgi:hypothetical protein
VPSNSTPLARFCKSLDINTRVRPALGEGALLVRPYRCGVTTAGQMNLRKRKPPTTSCFMSGNFLATSERACSKICRNSLPHQSNQSQITRHTSQEIASPEERAVVRTSAREGDRAHERGVSSTKPLPSYLGRRDEDSRMVFRKF